MILQSEASSFDLDAWQLYVPNAEMIGIIDTRSLCIFEIPYMIPALDLHANCFLRID